MRRVVTSRVFHVLLLSLAGLFLFDLGVFHSGLYARILDPDSTTGYLESIIYEELHRSKDSPNQIVAIGDSRMALIPRVANEMETGYTYGSLGVAGASPRAWYYILRAVDPLANRYRAIVIHIDTFDDTDTWEDLPNRDLDVNYLAARLGFRDLPTFPFSFTDPARRWRIARGIVLKGMLYKRDLEDFLLDPLGRMDYARESRKYGFNWRYDNVGDSANLEGLEVDWENREVNIPSRVTPETAAAIRRYLVEPLPPERGVRTAYLKDWFGRIQRHYAGSGTKLIFVRVPRGPWIRPDLPPVNPDSSVRQLAAQEPNVVMLDEHLTDVLETPTKFRDELHLSYPGQAEYTHIVVDAVSEQLGPPL